MVQLFSERARAFPELVIAGHCSDRYGSLMNAPLEFDRPPFVVRKDISYPAKRCHMFQGFAGVCYRRSFFSISKNGNVNFNVYLKTVLSSKNCFLVDDFVISNFMALQGIGGMDFNFNFKLEKMTSVTAALTILDYGLTKSAISKNIGNRYPNLNCSNFLKQSHSHMSFLRAGK